MLLRWRNPAAERTGTSTCKKGDLLNEDDNFLEKFIVIGGVYYGCISH